MICLLFGALALSPAALPEGPAPEALTVSHFPGTLHAFVWRNWGLVPPERMAKVAGATPDQIVAMGRRMGLTGPPPVSEDQWRRSYITIIRRNWHLLPYGQLLELLDWTEEEMAYALREDDFLFVKLGSLKPKVPALVYSEQSDAVREREAAIAGHVAEHFPDGAPQYEDPLFGFVERLSSMPEDLPEPPPSRFSPRYCYSYFALYGDALLDPAIDPYPEGYLARLAASGVQGVWLQGVLFKLTPFPWDASLSEHWEERLANLRALVARAKKHGISLYLYMNEPRSMPVSFFENHPELRGVTEGNYAALCTSVPEVRGYLRGGIARICREVPDLGGFFTITGSENFTNCWSHYQGANCPRCKEAGPAAVIAGVNRAIQEGIAEAGTGARLIAWDWGWRDEWATDAIALLPEDVAFMSVSEWSIPVKRGGIDSVIGEYSISAIGPGPRATKHWAAARRHGLKTLAKVQVNNTWELSPVPYVPVLENVARHAGNLREAGVDGLMLSWTLGGYPSPNLEAVAGMGAEGEPPVDEVLLNVAARRYGERAAPHVVEAWRGFSAAYQEYPFHGTSLYRGPQQMGPANLLWEAPTGYGSTMVGIPYDDLAGWRSVYPPEVYRDQFAKMAAGFDAAIGKLEAAAETADTGTADTEHAEALAREIDVARACAIHLRSVANQADFVMARDALAETLTSERPDMGRARNLAAVLRNTIESERDLALQLYAIQTRDSRIGYEASNHYFYVPMDLAEKVINCEYLLEQWLPAQEARL